jgi:glyoxylase-like metal-dependent hydrolase (beta-lactamase superfamily II)
MQRERVTDDIYVFTSDLYAQVTAGVIVTSQGAVLIDTLVYPEETRFIRRFVEERLGTTVQYVVNTHFHADHSTGTCFFRGARIIGHVKCRELLDQRGRESLERAKASSNEMRDVELVLPDIVFDSSLTLHLGNKTLQFWHSPGHSPDSIVCFVKEDQVLFAADTVMPIPYFVDGSYEDFVASLEKLRRYSFENIVQGHGDVILRGEVEEKIDSDINYLHTLRKMVDAALLARSPEKALEAIDVESCGKSRILLNGAVQQLHRQNVAALASARREHVQLQLENEQ